MTTIRTLRNAASREIQKCVPERTIKVLTCRYDEAEAVQAQARVDFPNHFVITVLKHANE